MLVISGGIAKCVRSADRLLHSPFAWRHFPGSCHPLVVSCKLLSDLFLHCRRNRKTGRAEHEFENGSAGRGARGGGTVAVGGSKVSCALHLHRHLFSSSHVFRVFLFCQRRATVFDASLHGPVCSRARQRARLMARCVVQRGCLTADQHPRTSTTYGSTGGCALVVGLGRVRPCFFN